MKATVEKIDKVAVVALPCKRLDMYNTGEFSRDIGPVLTSNPRVVFDLSNLSFVDHSGFDSILSYLRRLKEQGGDLKLCCLTRQVRVIFEIVRLHRVIEIFKTREEAVRAFRAFRA